MKINHNKKIGGFSVAEILLSIGIFMMLSSAVIFAAYDSNRLNTNNYQRINSAMYFDEYYNALVDSKNSLWGYLINNTNAGPKSLMYADNKYNIIDGPQNLNGINIYFVITDVYRDAGGNIVTSGGTIDIRSRKIILTGAWTDVYGNTITYTSDMYVNDWNTLELMHSTTADFTGGVNNNTIITTKVDGEVQLGGVIYADWCKPSITAFSFDLPGQGIAKTISARPGMIYAGTGANASGVSLMVAGVVPGDPPVVTNRGTFDGYKTNGIYGGEGYALIATDANSKEVVIVNTSVTPFVETGYFDAPGNGDGTNVFAVGNVGYLIVGNTLYTFDITSRSGSRTQQGSISLSGNATKMIIKNNYAYISTSGSIEMDIVDVTNPASMTMPGHADVSANGAISLYINDASTRAYILGNQSSSYNEVFIVDITNKTGTRSSISSFNIPTLITTDIGAPEGFNRLVISGTGTVQQYQVFNIDNELAPVSCGGLTVSTGINSFSPVTESDKGTYSYIVTNDSVKELMIIRGGPGGGGDDGHGYPPTGEYTSNIIDSNSDNAVYYTLRWTGTVPSGSTLQIQIRSGSSPSDILSQTFVGPDGTSATYFTAQTPTTIPSSINGKRYLQYKIFYTSNTIQTAVLSDISINYQK